MSSVASGFNGSRAASAFYIPHVASGFSREILSVNFRLKAEAT
jgi:hypothetical protein